MAPRPNPATPVSDRRSNLRPTDWPHRTLLIPFAPCPDSPGRESDREEARKILLELGGYDVETGIGPWDPLNLALVTSDAMDVGARLRWYRQAEIKHGRVSMAAFVGWIISQNGFSWPWIEKASVSTNPLETWSNTPWQYQWGFLLSCGIIEYRTIMGGWKVDPSRYPDSNSNPA